MRLDSPGLPFTDAPKLVGNLPIRMEATFNPDATCRMTLSRFWGDGPHALLIGANPSNAGEERNDPTSLAWVHFVRLWGFQGSASPRLCRDRGRCGEVDAETPGGNAVIIAMISGVTRIIGKSQGFLGLPLRDELIDCPVCGPDTPSMVTAWEPTPEELAKLNAGAPVLLRILGSGHPPVMLTVGDVPE